MVGDVDLAGRGRSPTSSVNRDPRTTLGGLRAEYLVWEHPTPFGKRVSRRGREKRDSEAVWLHNFVYLGGGRRRHEDTVEALFPVIFLGRAAKNNVGQEARVHEMRTMWSPYDQSCNLGGPADPLAQLFYRRVCPD